MPTSHVRRRVPAAAAAALTLLLGAALAGCSDGEGASASEGPDASSSAPASVSPSPSADDPDSASASASASGDEDASEDAEASGTDAEDVPTAQDEAEAPELPDGLKNNADDRSAFAGHVVDAWIYAFLTNDVGPLLDVSVKGGCQGCGDLRKEMRNREKDGYFVELVGVGLGETQEPDKQPPGNKVTITKTSLALPESRILEEDGTLRAISPAHPDTTFTAKVKWLPSKATKAKGKKNTKTPGELRLVSFGVETNDG